MYVAQPILAVLFASGMFITNGSQSLQSGADFDVFGEGGEDGPALRADAGGHNHSVGLDAAEFARREIHHHHDLAADQSLRLAMRSTVLICPTRISTFAKSSIAIFSGAVCAAAPEAPAVVLAAGAAAGF